jgi:hypothetical protein
VHRALGAAGIESNVVAAGPMAAAVAAGEDGSVAVVVKTSGRAPVSSGRRAIGPSS